MFQHYLKFDLHGSSWRSARQQLGEEKHLLSHTHAPYSFVKDHTEVWGCLTASGPELKAPVNVVSYALLEDEQGFFLFLIKKNILHWRQYCENPFQIKNCEACRTVTISLHYKLHGQFSYQVCNHWTNVSIRKPIWCVMPAKCVLGYIKAWFISVLDFICHLQMLVEYVFPRSLTESFSPWERSFTTILKVGGAAWIFKAMWMHYRFFKSGYLIDTFHK